MNCEAATHYRNYTECVRLTDEVVTHNTSLTLARRNVAEGKSYLRRFSVRPAPRVGYLKLITFQHHDRRCCHALTAAERAEALGARGLDVEQRALGAQRLRQPRAHLIEVRLELWRLRDDSQIGVHQAPSARRRQPPYFC